MKPAIFLKHRIEQQLKYNGIEYEFTRYMEDKYHQVVSEEEEKIVITGIYHETNSHITETGSDGSVTTSKPVPMILCLWSDASNIKNGDIVEISGNRYKVTGSSNIQNYDIAGDISLELIK